MLHPLPVALLCFTLLAAPGLAEPLTCPVTASSAVIFYPALEKGETGGPVWITNAFLDRAPEIDSLALVVPIPAGEPIRLRVVATEALENDSWSVRLADAQGTPLERLRNTDPARRPEYPSDAVVVWPTPTAGSVERVPVEMLKTEALPPEVVPGVVDAALALHGEGVDLLVVEFCCGDRTHSDRRCDYHCGEIWQKLQGEWTLCAAWQPA